MPYYESVFIARQDVSSAQVNGLADNFAEIIGTNGGQVTKREYWGLKTLAYRIKKNRKGHYVLFNIDGPWAAVAEMERNMRLNEDVLRYLTIKVDELEEGPSAVMQGRGSRDERRGRGGRDGRDGDDRRPRRRSAEGGPEAGGEERRPRRRAAEAGDEPASAEAAEENRGDE